MMRLNSNSVSTTTAKKGQVAMGEAQLNHRQKTCQHLINAILDMELLFDVSLHPLTVEDVLLKVNSRLM